MDAGLGKKNIIAILDDDSLTMHKVPVQNVRSYQEPLCVEPDTTLLLKAVIKAKDDKFFLCLLLRACSQLSLKVEPSHTEFHAFIQMLCLLSKSYQHTHQADNKTASEKALMLSWELLLDAQESNHQIVFLGSQSTQSAVKVSSAHENQQINFEQSNDYVQPKNSYLLGLPEAQSQGVKHQSRLKLLHAWEKNVFPGMYAFCQGHLQQWEFEYFFEQIRHQLRQG